MYSWKERKLDCKKSLLQSLVTKWIYNKKFLFKTYKTKKNGKKDKSEVSRYISRSGMTNALVYRQNRTESK